MRPERIRPESSQEIRTGERCSILEVANDEGDDKRSIARARVQPGVTTEWHEPVDTEERYAVVEGLGRVAHRGFAPARVQHGNVVRVPANTPQRIMNTAPGDLGFYCIRTPRFVPGCCSKRPDLEEGDGGGADE